MTKTESVHGDAAGQYPDVGAVATTLIVWSLEVLSQTAPPVVGIVRFVVAQPDGRLAVVMASSEARYELAVSAPQVDGGAALITSAAATSPTSVLAMLRCVPDRRIAAPVPAMTPTIAMLMTMIVAKISRRVSPASSHARWRASKRSAWLSTLLAVHAVHRLHQGHRDESDDDAHDDDHHRLEQRREPLELELELLS